MKSALIAALIALAVAACATRPPPAAESTARSPTESASSEADLEKAEAEERQKAQARLPRLELTPQWLFGLTLAEVAAQRGHFDEAAALYQELARETRDPRIARRATEIALVARQFERALATARLWFEADPDSQPARQALIGLLAATGQLEELKSRLPQMLAAEPMMLPRNLLQLPRLFARGGDRQAIRQIIDEITTPYLDLPEAHFARAQAALDARDLAGARQAIERALALRPDWEMAALFRAQVTADRQEALAALGAFVAAQPQAREARLVYARALVNEKRYAEARREFRRLLEQTDPARHGDIVFAVAMLSLQLGDRAEAERHLRRLLDIGHAEADRARFFLGQIAEEAGRHEEALTWYEAVAGGEHRLPARLRAAQLLAKQGRLEAARTLLHATDTARPGERVQLVLGEAQLLREAGRLAEAHGVLVSALDKQPDQPELLYETALVAEKLGRLDELEARLRRLIELKPDHAHAYNALGYSFADRNIRLDEARILIDKALELAPDDPFILDSKGWLLYRLGQREAALEVLQKAYDLRADPEIAAHTGEVLWSLGRHAEARQLWEKARQAHPDNEVLAETMRRFLP